VTVERQGMPTRERPLAVAEAVLDLITDIRATLDDWATQSDDWFHKFVIVLNPEDQAEMLAWPSRSEQARLWGCKTVTGDVERGSFVIGYERSIAAPDGPNSRGGRGGSSL
jgi:hypothetical protein